MRSLPVYPETVFSPRASPVKASSSTNQLLSPSLSSKVSLARAGKGVGGAANEQAVSVDPGRWLIGGARRCTADQTVSTDCVHTPPFRTVQTVFIVAVHFFPQRPCACGHSCLVTMAAYKASEKRWKRLAEEELLQDPELLDPRNLSEAQQVRVRRVGTWRWAPEDEERPVLSFDDFGASHRGFCVIPNALSPATQLQFAHACLYVPLSARGVQAKCSPLLVSSSSSSCRTEFAEEPHVTNMHQQQQQVQGIWRRACESHPTDPAQSPLLAKLCWAASGYHYDWTARKYYKDSFSTVPEMLQQLGARCAAACGMTLEAEAVIVNYYKHKSTMGGHLDDVEYTMDHPVVSLSLGSRCVFLMGGHTKDEPPLEVLLRSGDVAVMGGASRTCYHGVARVLPTPFSEAELGALPEREAEREKYEAVRTYLSTQRININVRQVYPVEESAAAE
jgi:alkylated DNA repair protein alkB family protein 1